MNNRKKEINLFTLYPKDDLTVEQMKPYKDKLDIALSDPRIKNMAITGPYDSGKSSLLKSYFNNRMLKPQKNYQYLKMKLLQKNYDDYEFINLPNFFYGRDLEDKENIEKEIEKEVVKQLLFTEDPFKYPYSRISRLKEYSKWKILGIDILIFISILFLPLKNITRDWNWESYIIFLILLILFSFKFVQLFSKLSISAKIKSPVVNSDLSTSLSFDSKENIDLFSYFEDEILYYFKKSNIHIVIFEDLDRFHSPIIFQKLHELNENLNKGKNKIVFIYTLKESVFAVNKRDDYENKAAEEKSKFFDCILPIFPLHSFQNSKNKWYKALNKCDFITKNNEKLHLYPSKNIIHNIGNLIFDNREILTIISELDIFAQKLPSNIFKNSTAIDKLLGTIVYKNIYPDDFEKITTGKSKIDYLMKNSSKLYSDVTYVLNEEYQTEINALNREINDIQTQISLSIRVYLKTKFEQIVSNKSFILNGEIYYADDNYEEFWKAFINEEGTEAEKAQISKVFDLEEEKKRQIKLYFDGKIENFEIKDLKNKNDNLKMKMYQNEALINSYNIGQVVDLMIKKGTSFIEKLKKKFPEEVIEYILTNDILRFLVTNNYLDNTFYDYISPDSFNTILTMEEREFVRNVESRRHIQYNQKLKNKDKVFEELNNLKVDYFYAYSTDILLLLCESNSLNNVKSLLSHVKENNDFKFIYSIIKDFSLDIGENLNKKKYIVLLNALIEIWPELLLKLKDTDNSFMYKEKLDFIDYLVTTISFNSNDLNISVFNFLVENKIIEGSVFKKYLNESNIMKKFFDKGRIFKFKDIEFFKGQRRVFPILITLQCYDSNSKNLKVIIDFYGGLRNLISKRKQLNISDKFIVDNIENYFNSKIDLNNSLSLNFDDLKAYIKFAQENSIKAYKKFAFSIYYDGNFDSELNNKEKINFLNSINIIEILKESKDIKKVVDHLLEENKIPYLFEFWKFLNGTNEEVAVDYFKHVEEPSVIADWFKHDLYWNDIMKYLSISKYPKEMVNEIDKCNFKWEEKDCDRQGLKYLIRYSENIKTIKKIINYKLLTNGMKDDILLLIFKRFKGKFTKSEISEFYFNDKNYIATWTIGKRKKIPYDLNVLDRVHSFSKILRPLNLVSKKSDFIMLKEMNDYFKE